MIYLKTYFHTITEINFINLQLMESYDHIDKFIICEYDIHHNGTKREFIWEECINLIHPNFLDKIIYLKCEISDLAIDATNNEHLAHRNETLMRGYFTKKINLTDEDIIISVDADEIIYNQNYPEIIDETKKKGKIKIALNQFFYRLNYHWNDNNFIAPTSALYKMYKNNFPSDWRYDGSLLNGKKGCHFSWCMSVESMLDKLNSYAHIKYKHLANKNILENAIIKKEYPFDPNKKFTIEIIDRQSDILPNSIRDSFFDNFYKKFTI